MANHSILLTGLGEACQLYVHGVIPNMYGYLMCFRYDKYRNYAIYFTCSISFNDVLDGVYFSYYRAETGVSEWTKLLNTFNFIKNVFSPTSVTDTESRFLLFDTGQAAMQMYRFGDLIRLQLSLPAQGKQPTLTAYKKSSGSWAVVPFFIDSPIINKLKGYMSNGTALDILQVFPDEVNTGVNIVIGAGGLTILGGGESPSQIYDDIVNNIFLVPDVEQKGGEECIISSDGYLTFVSNYQTGYSSSRRLIFDQQGYFRPAVNGTLYLGGPNNKFNQVYCTNPTISTSDIKHKYDVSYIGEKSEYDTNMSDEMLIKLIMGLKPVVYKRIDGESKRFHHGIISNDFEELLNELGIDHAGFIKSPLTREKIVYLPNGKKTIEIEEIPGEYEYGMRYEELISDDIKFSQILYKENQELKSKVSECEEKINKLEEEISKIYQLLDNK